MLTKLNLIQLIGYGVIGWFIFMICVYAVVARMRREGFKPDVFIDGLEVMMARVPRAQRTDKHGEIISKQAVSAVVGQVRHRIVLLSTLAPYFGLAFTILGLVIGVIEFGETKDQLVLLVNFGFSAGTTIGSTMALIIGQIVLTTIIEPFADELRDRALVETASMTLRSPLLLPTGSNEKATLAVEKDCVLTDIKPIE